MASKTTPADLVEELQLLLDRMTQEEADAIIGTPTDEYTLLGKAMKALYGLQWAGMMKSGLRKNALSLRRMGQNMILMSVVVHLAYAMGIRRGREECKSG